jgi:polyphosphate kinase 2 (PPK2 family)
MVIFDRSWYNRAGVEHVMGFCGESENQEFLHSCPEFERMLVRSGIALIKYWFSVRDEEQERRFHDRMNDVSKRWKIKPDGSAVARVLGRVFPRQRRDVCAYGYQTRCPGAWSMPTTKSVHD